MEAWREAADHFLRHEKPFRLGVLPTEQSHPKTRGLAETLGHDITAGLRMLSDVDRDVVTAAGRAFAEPDFANLVSMLSKTLREGGRICFSGCGATGRLSILLEAAWRHFWRNAARDTREPTNVADAIADRVTSIMTGGDHALIRSVERFEDYAAFGRQQVRDAGLGEGDTVVGISEGGETSSVIGTILEARDRGATTCFVFNNPSDILVRHVERSRDVIEREDLVKLDLSSGPMAVAGSTRMQAVTAELLVVGAALEIALAETFPAVLALPAFGERGAESTSMAPAEYLRNFMRLLDDLSRPAAMRALAEWVALEQNVYTARGRVTYYAVDALLDIFTDTTERGPTFMLPPLRKCDDHVSHPSWAFVKNPLRPTPAAWRCMLGREPRGLDWDRERYEALGGPSGFRENPPRLGRDEIMKFMIGNEDDPSRRETPASLAVAVLLGAREVREPDAWIEAFRSVSAAFPRRAVLAIGPAAPPVRGGDQPVLHVPCALPESPLKLWDHLAVKLAFNLVSTATMGRMGRLTGNWMTHVEPTNKKLIDRGIRLIAELAGVDYKTACYALHETCALQSSTGCPGKEKTSPVAQTLERMTKVRGYPKETWNDGNVE